MVRRPTPCTPAGPRRGRPLPRPEALARARLDSRRGAGARLGATRAGPPGASRRRAAAPGAGRCRGPRSAGRHVEGRVALTGLRHPSALSTRRTRDSLGTAARTSQRLFSTASRGIDGGRAAGRARSPVSRDKRALTTSPRRGRARCAGGLHLAPPSSGLRVDHPKRMAREHDDSRASSTLCSTTSGSGRRP